ncbi:MAG: antibiotic biosynthesis monooxygenase [Bryobacteraceae bacterium]
MRLLARSFTLLGRWAPVLAGSLLIDMAVASGAPAQTGVGPVYEVTYLDVAANSVGQGIALLKKYRELSRHESGNLEFTALQETIRPNRFVIFEGWKDQAAFDAHAKAESSSKFQEALTPIRNSPPYSMMQYNFATAPAGAKPAPGALYMVEHMDFKSSIASSVQTLVQALAGATQKEEGVIRYDAYHWGDHHYAIVAVWPNRKAFDAHEAAAYTRRFRAATTYPVGGRYDFYEERLYKSI